MYDAETGEELLVLAGHIGRVLDVAVSPECVGLPDAPFEWCGKHLATAADDGTVRIWDVSPTGEQELLVLPGFSFTLDQAGTRLSTSNLPRFAPQGASVSVQTWTLPPATGGSPVLAQTSTFQLEPGSQAILPLHVAGIVATGVEGGPIRFWDMLEGGKELYVPSCCTLLPGSFASSGQFASPALFPIQISPSGEQLAIIKDAKTVELWDVTTGHKALTLPERSIPAGQAWFSADGNWLAVGDCTGTVDVWDTATGENKHTLPGHTACITGVAFSPDGKLLAVSTVRGALKLWDFDTGEELSTLPVMGFGPQFTPDGTALILVALGKRGFVDTTVRMYLVRLEDLVALAQTRVTRTLTAEECQNYLHMNECPAGQ
jgi:WD40 repeat protein